MILVTPPTKHRNKGLNSPIPTKLQEPKKFGYWGSKNLIARVVVSVVDTMVYWQLPAREVSVQPSAQSALLGMSHHGSASSPHHSCRVSGQTGTPEPPSPDSRPHPPPPAPDCG